MPELHHESVTGNLGQFYLTGKMVLNNTGRSFRVYSLTENGKFVFVGFVSVKAILDAKDKRITQADICKFSQTVEPKP